MINVDQTTRVRSKVEERELFVSLTSGLVDWVRLKPNAKSPWGYRKDHLVYSKKMHSSSNVGAHPVGQTVTFDIDTHAELSPADQFDLLLERFGVDLRGSLTVGTPSGGLHVYTLWPLGVELPGNWKLANFKLSEDENDTLKLSGDLRAAGVNGHCVIPGSVFNGSVYRVVDDSPVRSISPAAARAFLDSYVHEKFESSGRLKSIEEVHGRTKSANRVRWDDSENFVKTEIDNIETMSNNNGDNAQEARYTFDNKIDTQKTNRLRKMVAEGGYTTWHAKRAAVFNALSCCHSMGLVFKYWVELDLCRDTASGNKVIRHTYLLRELKHLKRTAHHGAYCGTSSVVTNRVSPCSAEFPKPHTSTDDVSWLQRKTTWRTPVVLHQGEMVKALSTGRKKTGKYHQLAVSIIEDFLQPWSNFGVSRIMLSSAYVADFYGVSAEDVSAAKKLLLRKGIIYVKVKQAQGRTTSFGVDGRFVDQKMTKLLCFLRKKGGEVAGDVFFDARSGIFYNGLSGEIDLELNDFARERILSSELGEELPERLSSFTVLARVLPEQKIAGFPMDSSRIVTNVDRKVSTFSHSDDELLALSNEELSDDGFFFESVTVRSFSETSTAPVITGNAPTTQESVHAVLKGSDTATHTTYARSGDKLSESNLAPVSTTCGSTNHYHADTTLGSAHSILVSAPIPSSPFAFVKSSGNNSHIVGSRCSCGPTTGVLLCEDVTVENDNKC